MTAQFQSFFSPDSGNYIEFQGLPFFLANSVSCDVGTPGNIIRPGSGLLNWRVGHVSFLLPALVYYSFYLSDKGISWQPGC